MSRKVYTCATVVAHATQAPFRPGKTVVNFLPNASKVIEHCILQAQGLTSDPDPSVSALPCHHISYISPSKRYMYCIALVMLP